MSGRERSGVAALGVEALRLLVGVIGLYLLTPVLYALALEARALVVELLGAALGLVVRAILWLLS